MVAAAAAVAVRSAWWPWATALPTPRRWVNGGTVPATFTPYPLPHAYLPFSPHPHPSLLRLPHPLPLRPTPQVGEWVGASSHSAFNFPPGVRPVPLEIHIQGFDINNFDARMQVRGGGGALRGHLN